MQKMIFLFTLWLQSQIHVMENSVPNRTGPAREGAAQWVGKLPVMEPVALGWVAVHQDAVESSSGGWGSLITTPRPPSAAAL